MAPLKNFRILHQINLISVATFCAFVLIAGIYLVGENSREGIKERRLVADEAHEISGRIRYGLLNARRHEKDFLLLHDTRYKDLHDQQTDQLLSDLENLVDLPVVSENRELFALAENVRTAIIQYKSQFDALFSDWMKIGLDGVSGFRGDMRRTINDIERHLADHGALELTVSLLTIRRHEREFRDRLDPSSVDRFGQDLGAFRHALADSDVPENVARAVEGALAEYWSAFEGFADTSRRAASGGDLIVQSFALLEPLLAGLADSTAQALRFADAKDHDLDQNLVWITAFVMLGVFVVVLALGIVIAGWIGTPIVSMTGAMVRLAEGDHAVEIPTVRAGRELTAMGETMQVFKDTAVARMRAEGELRALNAELEGRVAERTRELEDEVEERKRAEATVRESEENLIAILDASPICVTITGPDGKRRYVNARLAEMVGRSKEELIGSTSFDSFADPAARQQLFEKFEAGEAIRDVDFEFVRANGEIYPVLLIVETIQYGGEECRISWLYDISERQQAEAELARQKAIADTTLENMEQGIVLFDANFELIAHNTKLRDTINLPEALFDEGASMEDWFRYVAERGDYTTQDGIDAGDIEAQVARRMDGLRRGEAMVYENPTLDGRIVEIRRSPVAGGGFVTTYTDITDRKQSEERLQDAYDIITGSIQYATRIQRSVLPPDEYLAEDTADYFVIWEPRDLVGGDIYWYRRTPDGFLVILTDCTGHGVPGAFMSLIATGAVDRALRENPAGEPARLIHDINRSVKRTLGQDRDDGESDDGLELGICLVETKSKRISFAGARFSLFHANASGVEEIKGDKVGVGYRRVPVDQTFTSHSVEIRDESAFYMTSDGLIDQVGGAKGRMFGKKRFVTLLAEVQGKPMSEQKDAIIGALVAYQGDQIRRDDVSIVGFAV